MKKQTKEEMLEKLNHPYYCVWCSKIEKDEQSFKEHYEKCASGVDEVHESMYKNRGELIHDLGTKGC